MQKTAGIDYTAAAVEKTRTLLHAQGLDTKVIQADVLAYQPQHKFDAVYEPTCLCAVHPEHWLEYAQQLHQWLKPAGNLWVLYMQMLRPSASEQGVIHGPTLPLRYQCHARLVYRESLDLAKAALCQGGIPQSVA